MSTPRRMRAAREGDTHVGARTTQTYIAGIGASGALLAGALVTLVALVGAVSFDVWPDSPGSTGPGENQVELRGPLASDGAPLSAADGLVAAAAPLDAPLGSGPPSGGRRDGAPDGGEPDPGQPGGPVPVLPPASPPPSDPSPAPANAPGGSADGGSADNRSGDAGSSRSDDRGNGKGLGPPSRSGPPAGLGKPDDRPRGSGKGKGRGSGRGSRITSDPTSGSQAVTEGSADPQHGGDSRGRGNAWGKLK